MKHYLVIIILLTGLIKLEAAGGKISGIVEAKKSKYKVNTIVFIEKVKGNFKPLKKNPVVNQKGLTFIPHVLPVVQGTTVDFLNSDKVLHNVFSPDDCAGNFNLGSWPQGKIKSKIYDNIGCESVVLCNVHPEMEAYVVVLQNPYFAVTNKNGEFQIDNVPRGTYILKVWNEKLKADKQEIKVTKSGTVKVKFKLKR